ncbi:MAG: hypothetical protein EPN69_03695 [Rhodanobacter sp.]|nr:MAG: hypothetical protein EPN69_03695 [Rhodanobacter sp.]TAM43244.1 MAG: hypothetical protein EPN58_00165 [Rhodanobacter sp.]TAN28905.1 MAG: hypothetical protein EPN32_01895 [Rhodanobacter sp.]
MPVVAIVASRINGGSDEVCTLCDITELPHDVLSFVQGRVPTFQLKYSKTVGGKYYANVCPKCHMLCGDFFLHSEPEAPFFPTDAQQTSQLYLTKIPVTDTVNVQASYHVGTGELMLEHATRIA